MMTQSFIEEFNQTISNEGLNLIRDFFITFSRFECALKASNFAQGDADRVSANWEVFLASIRHSFDKEKNDELKVAVDYIIQNPPKVQMYNNGQLGWKERSFQTNEPEINKLGSSIKDVRNNLFHGGKFNGTYEADISRNAILLKNAIIILNDWLSLSNNVRNSFLEPIE